jgi:hypothetical protein
MRVSHVRLAALALTGGILLSGCAYDMYGDPYGYGGYGNYGYGNYGYGYPYSGYGGYGGYGAYSGYGGYGYSYDPFGWYGDFYYPGAGIYVYDRSRTRHVWSGDQQRYWTQRRGEWQQHSGTTTSTGANWSGWDRSHWRDRTNSGSPATTTSTGGWSRGSRDWNRSNWQGRSPTSTSTTTTTTRSDRGERGGRGHRHGDRDD